MKLSQAINKLKQIQEKYGDLEFVQNSSKPCGYEYFNFYLREVNVISKDYIGPKVVVCTCSDGLEFNPEIGDEDPTPISDVNDKIN